METYDQRIDAYIATAAKFAQPILKHIRSLVHQACPNVKETIKWGFPHFEYKGIVCNMAAFKQHCAFGFYKSSLLSDTHQILNKENTEGMGQFGRLTSLADLPEESILSAYIREAVELNEKGIKLSKSVSSGNHLIEVPPYFSEILNRHEEANTFFENLSNSHRKEYIQWIVEAKSEQTRNKRMNEAVSWLSEGKTKNWKYVDKS